MGTGSNPERPGQTLTGFSGRDRVCSIQFGTEEKPFVFFGNDLIDRPANDGASGGIFIDERPFTVRARLLEWAFYDNDNFSPDRQITPLVLEKVGTNYIVRGIGATRTTTELGEQRYLFDLVAGTDLVGPGYFFGWRDGSLTTTNQGVIDFTDGVGAVRYFGAPASFGLDGNLGAGAFYARTYSFQTIQVIPEPTSLALLGIGASMVPLIRRRRRTARAA